MVDSPPPIDQISFVTSSDLIQCLKRRSLFLYEESGEHRESNGLCPLYTPLNLYTQHTNNCKRHCDVLSLVKILDANNIKLLSDEDVVRVAVDSYNVAIDYMSRSRKAARNCTCGTCLIKVLLLAADICLSVSRVHMRYFQLVEARKTLSQSSNLVDLLVDKVNSYYRRECTSEDSKESSSIEVDLYPASRVGAKIKMSASVAMAYYNLDSNNLAECLTIVEDTFNILLTARADCTDDEHYALLEADLLIAKSIALSRLGLGCAMSTGKMAMIVLINAISSHERSTTEYHYSLPKMLIRAVLNLAVLYRDQGDAASAEAFVKVGLEKFCSLRTSTDYSHLLLTGATILCEQPSVQQLEQYEEVLRVRAGFHGHDHPAVAYVYNLMGLFHLAQDEHSLCERYFSLALGIYKSKLNSPVHPNIAQSLSNIGLLQFRKGDFAKAFSYQSRALDMLCSVAIDEVVIANALIDLAETYAALGKTADACETVSRAIAIYERSMLPRRNPYDIIGLLCGKSDPLLSRAVCMLRALKSCGRCDQDNNM